MIGGASLRDRFYITPEYDLQNLGKRSRFDTTGRVLVDPRPVAGERTLTLICAGQSNIANACDTPYTPTNVGKVLNLNIWDGGLYRYQDPVLGASAQVACWVGRLGDKLINAGRCERVVLVTIGMGASFVIEHTPGNPENSKITAAVERCRALGLTVSAFLWMQGEADNGGTSQADYTTRLQQVIATPRAIGETAPWYIAKCTLMSGVTSATIRAAQASVVNGDDVRAGPDTDTLTGANRWDTTHLSGTGANACADLWVTALSDLVPS